MKMLHAALNGPRMPLFDGVGLCALALLYPDS
jgi:hypothetical protein